MAIPQDSDSVELAIKKKNLQTFTWLLCCKKKNIQNLDSEEFGWADGKPRWFNGDQFPSSISKRTQGKHTDGNNADSESNNLDDGPPKKKPQTQASIIKSKKTKQITRRKNKRS